MPTIARPFIAVLAITAAITTTKGTMEIAFPPYLAGYGYALSLIGFLTSLIAVLQLVSRLPVGVAYRADRVKRQFALALVAFAISTSGFAFAGGQPLAVAALSVLHGFAFGSLGTLGLALAIDVSGGRRAGVSMAWYTAANSTGYALGALIGGSLADTIGIPPTLGLIGLLPLAAAAVVLALPPVEAAPFPIDRGSGLRGPFTAGGPLDSRVWLAIGTIAGRALGCVVASAFGIAAMFQIMAVLSLLAWVAVAMSSPAAREAAGLTKRHTSGPSA